MKTTATARFRTRDLTLTAVFSAFTAVMTQIQIPLPGEIPFSLGIMAVMLASVILPTRLAVASQIVYLLIGAVGAPVFTGFEGGLRKLVGPTGGYLIGYILMALTIGLLLNLRKRGGFLWQYFAVVLGTWLCYACGTIWLCFSTGMGVAAALMMAVVPFAVFDLIKAAIAVSACRKLRVALGKQGLL